MQTTYSIRDLEHLSGVKAHTLRIWESRYNLMSPGRTDTNIRYYGDHDLRKILNVSVLINMGWRISQVARLSDDELAKEVLSAKPYEGHFAIEMRNLKEAMLTYDENAFRGTLQHCISTYGFEATLNGVLKDFMDLVGVLWQTGTITVAHEHFASNFIKQKLHAAIDAARFPLSPDAREVVLYLPADELHELGLLYLHYWLKKAGHRVVYLGQSTPSFYLREYLNSRNADFVVGILTTRPEESELRSYLKDLMAIQTEYNTRFLLTGYRMQSAQINGESAHIQIFKSVEDIRALLCKPSLV